MTVMNLTRVLFSRPLLTNYVSFHHFNLNVNQQWGVSKIHVVSVIASKQGLTELLHIHPDVHVTLGHVDDELTADGNVMPGLGDAGDRLFGTASVMEDEEELVHPSKRKRTMSMDSGSGH